MTKFRVICFLLFLVLGTVSCSKALTICMINRSNETLNITDHGKDLICEPGKMVSFIPERKDGNDIVIQAEGTTFSYVLANTPTSYLDIAPGARPCLWLVFKQDNKLYLLKPSKEPLNENVGVQPPDYPLAPYLSPAIQN
jgi:hypothetical protein